MVPFKDYQRLLEIEGLTATQWSVLSCLAWHFNKETGQCNPIIPTIAKECRIKPSTARKALDGLEEKGIISRLLAVVEGKNNRFNYHYTPECLGGEYAMPEEMKRFVAPSGERRRKGKPRSGIVWTPPWKQCATTEHTEGDSVLPDSTPKTGNSSPTHAESQAYEQSGDGEQLIGTGNCSRTGESEPPPLRGGGKTFSRKQGKLMEARYPGFCRLCKSDIQVGEQIRVLGPGRSVHDVCPVCHMAAARGEER